jgi:hypothetical protein
VSFRADFDGAFPGLKAWAVLLNRFAFRSNRLVYKAQRLKPWAESSCPFGFGAQRSNHAKHVPKQGLSIWIVGRSGKARHFGIYFGIEDSIPQDKQIPV